MSGWVKTSVDWFEDPQIEELGAEATVLHLSGLAYTARHLRNGRLPIRALRRLYPVPDQESCVRALVETGTWQPVEDGFLIVDWRKHILSSEEVDRMRKQSQITSERYRRHKGGDHSMCDRCSSVRKQRDGVTAGVSDAAPSPIRTEGEERRGEEETGSSASSDGSAPLAASSPTPPVLLPAGVTPAVVWKGLR